MASSARIDELLKKFEENPRRYFAPLANEYRKAGDVERAIQLCREHLPQQPGHMSGHIVFGQALFEAHQFDEARQVFTAALALDPENLIALRHLGDIARGEGDLVGARDWYQRVLDADPRNEEIGALLASLDAAESAPAEHAAAASADEITPIHISTGAFAAVANAGAEATPAAPVADGNVAEPAPEQAEPEAAPLTMSAMDFALASISSDAPPAARERREEPAAPESAFAGLDLDAMEARAPASGPPAPSADAAAHGESEFDISYVTGGSAGDEMELTPAHGASALVSRAEPPDDASTFAFGETLGGDDDRSPFDLAADAAPAIEAAPATAATVAPEPATVAPPAPPAPVAAAATPPPPAARAMDDRPLGLESMEFVPPSRDAEPDPMQGHLLTDEEPASSTPAAFVTETMAELYLQQGFRDEALSVYRQLLAQSPADENLRDRVAQLESGSRSSVSVAGISDTVIEAARQRQTAPAPKKTAREFFAALANWRSAAGGEHVARPGGATDEPEMSGGPERGPELGGFDALADAPGASGHDRSPAAPAVDEFGFPVNFDSATAVVHRDLGAPRLEEEPRGVDLGAALIGDDLALDAAEELPASAAIEPATLDYAADGQAPAGAGAAQSGDAASMSGFDVLPPEEMTGDRYGQVESHHGSDQATEDVSFAPPTSVGRLSGPVDTLFGDGAVPSRDEVAASALANAFGGDPAAADAQSAEPEPGHGTPARAARQGTGEVRRATGGHAASSAARPAGAELSLDHVFRDTPRRGAEKRREAPAFSFDQFFSDGAGPRGAESPSAPTPAEGNAANGDEGADIEQFNAWLEGLKKK